MWFNDVSYYRSSLICWWSLCTINPRSRSPLFHIQGEISRCFALLYLVFSINSTMQFLTKKYYFSFAYALPVFRSRLIPQERFCFFFSNQHTNMFRFIYSSKQCRMIPPEWMITRDCKHSRDDFCHTRAYFIKTRAKRHFLKVSTGSCITYKTYWTMLIRCTFRQLSVAAGLCWMP